MTKADFAIQLLKRQINPHGTPPLLRNILLIALSRQPEQPMTIHQLSNITGNHSKNLSRTLERMIDLGWIRDEYNPLRQFQILNPGLTKAYELLKDEQTETAAT